MTTVSMISVPIAELKRNVSRAVRAVGYRAADAEVLTEIMTFAELHGNDQGISKMYEPSTGLGHSDAEGELAVERETPSSAVVNGNKRAGMVAMNKALALALAKTARGGFAVTGTRNTSTSTGMLAFYASQIAARGFVGMVMAGSPEFVAPYGSTKGVFGTNPICFGIPSSSPDGPLIFDMATAGTTLYGAVTSKATGRPLKPGVAIGPDGKPTTDAAAALSPGGAFRTWAGYKSDGLALMVELLASVLPGAAVVGKDFKRAAKNWGNVIICFDPELLQDRASFMRKVAIVTAHVKQSGPNVILPGEIERKKRDANLKAGTIPVAKALYDKILSLGAPTSRL